MLPLDVRACLSDLMAIVYTRTIMELLANKFGVMPEGENKLKVAMDFLSKIPPERELELVQKVVRDARETVARGGYGSDLVHEKLGELERVLEVSMLMYADSHGNISPIVETSIRPDVEEQKGYLQREMTELGFTLARSHLTQALETYRVSYPGSIALFRNSLQALVEDIVQKRGRTPLRVFTDTIRLLTDVGVLKRSERDEELKAIESLFRMLSHYGSHPEYVTEEVANFLYLWTISVFSFILKRYRQTES